MFFLRHRIVQPLSGAQLYLHSPEQKKELRQSKQEMAEIFCESYNEYSWLFQVF